MSGALAPVLSPGFQGCALHDVGLMLRVLLSGLSCDMNCLFRHKWQQRSAPLMLAGLGHLMLPLDYAAALLLLQRLQVGPT
jgi:hypothetical protein